MVNVRVRSTPQSTLSPSTFAGAGELPRIIVELEGDITDASNLGAKFEMLALPEGSLLRVQCDQVRYINSVGVKQWIVLFEGYRLHGVRLQFQTCSPAVVAQLNLIANFVRPDEILSLQLPYVCTSCHHEQLVERAPAELKSEPSAEVAIADLPCEACGAVAAFDDNPDEYFHFLR